MKYIFTFFLCLIFINVKGQDFVFFSDSPLNTYYDFSFGEYTQPSTLELVNSVKAPVSASNYFSGLNSIKLSWSSKPGGSWNLAIAENGWPGHDISGKDSLSFYIYSEDVLQSVALPAVFLEDLNNVRTPKVNISSYINGIPAGTWTRVNIPLSAFETHPGSADLKKVKTVFFSQSADDGTEHTVYIDEIRMVNASGSDTQPPAAPSGVKVTGYAKHIDVKWNISSEPDIMGYYIYKQSGSSYNKVGQASKDVPVHIDWVNSADISGSYRISAYDSSGNESVLTEPASAVTHAMTDSEYLDMVQEATFRYFWDYAHPVSGMARERLGSGNTVTTGGTGFGIMTIPAAIERGYITREQGAERILKLLNFLNNADRFHGAWPHWMNGNTGKVIPFSTYDNGGDLVETGFLVQGILTVRQYFNNNSEEETRIRNLATSLWESVEWDWYLKFPSSNYLYWHWSPNYGFQINMQLKGWNEAMIVYLLAIASPTHHISPSLYYLGWAGDPNYRNGKTYYDKYKLDVGWDYGGRLFFAHYSFLGFDPRNKKDTYTNYFRNNRNAALIHSAYSEANPLGFAGYNKETWGLTSSDDPVSGYREHEPYNDNGTIAPTAALSSFPYTPEESMAALKSFYNNYGNMLWGPFGFKDAFNVSRNWFAQSYLAIDQGPIMVMIENYRSSLLWHNFMANPEIQPMLDAIGFVPDLTDVSSDNNIPVMYELKNNYPNPFNPVTTIEYSIPSAGNVQLVVYDITGKEIMQLVNEVKEPGTYKIQLNASHLTSGVYFYRIKSGGFSETKKLVLIK